MAVLTEATTSRTLALTDAGDDIYFTNASPSTCTVPPNSSVAFAVGDVINLVAGPSALTVAEGAGVTINALDGDLTTQGAWSAVSVQKTATDTWFLIGATGAGAGGGGGITDVTTETGTTHTLDANDVDTLVLYTNASPVTVTLPEAVMALGEQIHLMQKGAGAVTVVTGTARYSNGADIRDGIWAAGASHSGA